MAALRKTKAKSRASAKRPVPVPGDGAGQALARIGAKIAVGHSPPHGLAPKDRALFQAFQSNLLSLVSHELRTPLTGILTALSLLEGGEEAAAIPPKEMITIARKNAERLNHVLASLLDLAAIGSGTFHARLREVDLPRLARAVVGQKRLFLADGRFRPKISEARGGAEARPVLGDPQKLTRALELGLQIVAERGEPDQEFEVVLGPAELRFGFHLAAPNGDRARGAAEWDEAWTLGAAGIAGGVSSPVSAFGGVVGSEREFLTRTREGLGSELLLVHEVMKLHGGRFEHRRQGDHVTLSLLLPELSSENGLMAVLGSRVYETTAGLSSVALALLRVPAKRPLDDFRREVQKSLFRASDAVYSLPARNELALVLDDCKPEDGDKLLGRLQAALGGGLRFGIATCPHEAADPKALVDLARARIERQ